MTARKLGLWGGAALFGTLVAFLFFCPAVWLAQVLEKQTAGRLTLGDPQGTLWSGSGFIGGAPAAKAAVTPLLPGRFVWHLSPLVLFGRVEMRLENPEAMGNPISISGSWDQWQVTSGSVLLPAERLVGLGAPLNTIVPSGQMRLSWGSLDVLRLGQRIDLHGKTTLALSDMGSVISAVKPLGSYQVDIQWQGQQAQLSLHTVKGALLLNGKGSLQDGHFQFSGKAEPAAGQEQALANLLSIMGQQRREGNKNIIALEFRQ
jgi:general secretion pathway protein N